ncbi:YciI family protein [Pseudolysobacter antarcticus]|uniref:YciI family protein n=2 Tax=Pseudolysobacter antarcticus TaxID=2511995 RepID=A0A411HQ18_9GAMM|nr:YciI family protein [Pseudolysobacter antarcticus]
MIMLKSDSDTEAGISPSAAVLAAMAQRNAEGVAAGILLAGEGLQSSVRGARLKFAQGRPALMDGPFTEAKEMIAGFWIMRAGSMQDAIDWVENYPYPRDPHTEFEVEIRPLYEAADFTPEFMPEIRLAEELLREDVPRAAHQRTAQA